MYKEECKMPCTLQCGVGAIDDTIVLPGITAGQPENPDTTGNTGTTN
jgi:hypothetical protein